MKMTCTLLVLPFVALVLSASGTSAASCTEVSVERDATYCIAGPICSGSGATPAGSLCPKKGDVAVKDCLKYLKSYVDGDKCVAPVDAQCVKIHTGAWGCVWPNATKSTPCPGIPGWEKPTTGGKATPCPGIPGWEKPSSKTPCPGIPGWEKPSTKTPCPGIAGWEKPSTKTPCPGIPGWEKPTPVPSTPCPVIPGWEKPTPAPSTPCPVIPGWEKPTPAPSTPCPVIPGWEKPTTAPATDAPTTAPILWTPAPVTPEPSKAPVTPEPTKTPATVAPPVVAASLSAVDESAPVHDQGNSNAVLTGAVVIGAVAAIAAVVLAYKKRRNSNGNDQEMDSPTVYNGTVQTPV